MTFKVWSANTQWHKPCLVLQVDALVMQLGSHGFVTSYAAIRLAGMLLSPLIV
jgi:hypothetical protein